MRTHAKFNETIVVFRIANMRFGIAAKAVEEICGVDDLSLLPRESRTRSIKHSLIRRGKEHLVIDGAAFFRIGSAPGERVLLFRGNPMGLLIGNVDCMQDVASLDEVPHAFQGDERHWFRGLVRLFDGVVPLVNPEVFLDAARSARQHLEAAVLAKIETAGAQA